MGPVAVSLLLFASVPALIRQGTEFYKQRNYLQAEKVFSQALQLEPGNRKARIFLARTLIAEGRTLEALRAVHVLLDSNPDDPEAQYEAGSIMQELADSSFQKIVSLAPEAAETHELLGKNLEAQGRLHEALAEYRSAMRRNPDAAGLHFLVGNVHWKLRDYDAALPELEAEIRRNPNHAMANHRIGNIRLALGQPGQALAFLERAVNGAPAFLDGHRDLGKAYRQAGRLRDALRELTLVAEKNPNDDSVHAQLALVFRALGDSKKAAVELEIQRRILRERLEAAQRK